MKKFLLLTLTIVFQMIFAQFENLPQKKMYFKPPPNWSNVCSYMNYIDPVTTIDFFPPGQAMSPACEGWYKTTYAFNKAYVEFNNCNYFGGSPNTNYLYYALETETDVFYDYSAGPISNPPACLLAVNDHSKKKNSFALRLFSLFIFYSLPKHHYRTRRPSGFISVWRKINV